MAARSNAGSELARIWLEHRHGCLVRESLQVPVYRNYSDIDFIAQHPTRAKLSLPNGTAIGPNIAVETKDEHDGPTGRDFGKLLRADVARLSSEGVIPTGSANVKFTMLKAEHFEVASKFFGTSDLDRLFIVHAIDEETRIEICPTLEQRYRIHWLTIPELVTDLFRWYEGAVRPEQLSLRNTLTGDLFHLLAGFCRFGPRN